MSATRLDPSCFIVRGLASLLFSLQSWWTVLAKAVYLPFEHDAVYCIPGLHGSRQCSSCPGRPGNRRILHAALSQSLIRQRGLPAELPPSRAPLVVEIARRLLKYLLLIVGKLSNSLVLQGVYDLVWVGQRGVIRLLLFVVSRSRNSSLTYFKGWAAGPCRSRRPCEPNGPVRVAWRPHARDASGPGEYLRRP